jgi:hypothetical protein
MKKIFIITAVCLFSIISQNFDVKAQGPRGNNFGFGLILGDPTGGTIKYWFSRENALVASLGNSYFGALRINVDYLWHFDAFNSQVVKMYAGIGGVLGIGEGNHWYYKHGKDDFWYRKDGTGLGVRATIGLNIIPRNAPIEIFVEAGPLIGIAPAFGSTIDASVGIRFYP